MPRDVEAIILTRTDGVSASFVKELMRRLAEQLHLLDAAIDGLAQGRAADAFVRVEALHDPRDNHDDVESFARAIAVMYRRWARRRRMESQVLLEVGDAADAMNSGRFDRFSDLFCSSITLNFNRIKYCFDSRKATV